MRKLEETLTSLTTSLSEASRVCKTVCPLLVVTDSTFLRYPLLVLSKLALAMNCPTRTFAPPVCKVN